ncbi:hypothetical protein [Blastopirellula marina]|uniref:Uncharacterized protein n=1 Tax=Blastopirellula marina TaxID=124 RepID=A0A2S8F4P0_9BACT|nr:hypothetical protein [Blastopirellula marina]PQO27097.1 hypothetical protein C5Y98_28005 [Blastopirellula marina]PTL41244.1 hypothetical protein C5Y97_28020 [Blastopirellula marina]
MDDREQLQQQMLELIYGLLSDQESAELVERISSNGELAREYAELKERTELLAEVTKVSSDPPNYGEWKRKAGEQDKPTPKSVTGATWSTRTLQTLSALAACLLVAALAYPKLTFNEQQQTAALQKQTQNLANDYLSLSITGPSLMATEVRNEFFVSVENAANQPVDAQVEYWFKSPANETVYYGLTEAKDGQVVCQIPADEVSSAAKLEVIAKRGNVQSTLGLDVKAAPPKPVAILQTDREVAQPGETVNFRAVVLDPQNQQDRSANVDFLWSMQNNRALNPITSAERSTLKGVAQGQLTIPAFQSSESVELTIESPELQNNFLQHELPVLVDRQDAGAYAVGSQNDAYGPDNRLGKVPAQLAAKPEGGNLVAGVENRLYYSNQAMLPGAAPARTQVRSAGQPAQQQQDETAFGSFRFVPQPAEEYTVEVVDDPEQPLEQQSFFAKQLPATLQVNNSVALANEPLEVDVRVAIPNTTMALVAGDDYATIGHNVWDVGVNAPITQPVKLNLPAEATGAQRVQLYSLKFDEATNTQQTPELIAERIIYRIPVHRYAVEVAGLPSQASPGEQLDLHVSVKDEYASPAQATLGIQMERLPDVTPNTQQPLGLEGEFLLNQRVVLPPTANTLPDDVRQLEQDRAYFDQVLALSDWRRQTSAASSEELLAQMPPATSATPEETSETPVIRRSNRRSIQTKYQQALAAIQQQWQARMDDVRVTSRWMLIIGGGVLAVGLIGLAVVQGRRKKAVWAPGLLVAFGSILWGMFSLSLSLNPMASPKNASYDLVAVSEEAKSGQPAVAEKLSELSATISEKAAEKSMNNAESNSQVRLRSQRADTSPAVAPMMVPAEAGRSQMQSMGGAGNPFERGGYGGANNQPVADQPAATMPMDAAVPEVAPRSMMQANAKQQTPQPILWQPRLTTNANGEVNLPVTLPQQPGRYRLVIDAHGSGRLGTVVRYVEVGSPEIAAPTSPAND